MDESDTYYTALALDSRVKGGLIMEELQDKNAGNLILQTIQSSLHERCPQKNTRRDSDIAAQQLPFQKLHPGSQPLLSDIDRYFDSPLVSITDTKDPTWLCNWWRTHKDEYPQMAAAARDYLAIPASEVAVGGLFNAGRDLW
jgi:hypothetical protein